MGHAYEVIGLEKKSERLYVKLRNPHGRYGRTMYDENGQYKVIEDEGGAVSFVEIVDFLDAFRYVHHTLEGKDVKEAIEAIKKSDIMSLVNFS
jgi:hypothetical protein